MLGQFFAEYMVEIQQKQAESGRKFETAMLIRMQRRTRPTTARRQGEVTARYDFLQK